MGLLRHLVFENPTTLWVLMGIGAAISAAAWRKTGSERARTTAIAFIVVGILVSRRAPLGPPPGGRRAPEPPPLLEA